eukprot:TRINITY_DN5531_c2_g1_i1.p4 TRINITY_DN5531_c2_g1~~TRINITY_DN5531_c2_g1_i1.p4  ORF type:complete len:126 (-),score=6.13 TRINITY_DN5531_c2_g1_i1:983-1360(-)
MQQVARRPPVSVDFITLAAPGGAAAAQAFSTTAVSCCGMAAVGFVVRPQRRLRGARECTPQAAQPDARFDTFSSEPPLSRDCSSAVAPQQVPAGGLRCFGRSDALPVCGRPPHTYDAALAALHTS